MFSVPFALHHFCTCSNALSRSPAADAAKQQKLVQPEKGPVMLLYELFNDIVFECVQTDGGQFSRFKMRVKVNDEVFEGTGESDRGRVVLHIC